MLWQVRVQFQHSLLPWGLPCRCFFTPCCLLPSFFHSRSAHSSISVVELCLGCLGASCPRCLALLALLLALRTSRALYIRISSSLSSALCRVSSELVRGLCLVCLGLPRARWPLVEGFSTSQMVSTTLRTSSVTPGPYIQTCIPHGAPVPRSVRSAFPA